jgi:hypothetical protein
VAFFVYLTFALILPNLKMKYLQDVHPEFHHQISRRSGRQRKPPVWMSSGTYELSKSVVQNPASSRDWFQKVNCIKEFTAKIRSDQ